ncbi:MAG: hypothetical protein CML68_24375 [Rhodobacteraceae bacterium]|nr:hypothetical protein [Paracoccaceae bacterium]
MDRYINMFVRMFMRQAMSRGISAGFQAVEKRFSKDGGPNRTLAPKAKQRAPQAPVRGLLMAPAMDPPRAAQPDPQPRPETRSTPDRAEAPRQSSIPASGQGADRNRPAQRQTDQATPPPPPVQVGPWGGDAPVATAAPEPQAVAPAEDTRKVEADREMEKSVTNKAQQARAAARLARKVTRF